VAALTPVVIFPQIGTSHCSQKNVLPFAGADFSGSVTPTVFGGVVIGVGTEATAFDAAPPLEPLLLALSELPQAASDTMSAAATGRTATFGHLIFTDLSSSTNGPELSSDQAT
jgi:hypothetical protein